MARRRSGLAAVNAPAFLTRRTPVYELLDEEGLEKLEAQADWILSEVGIETRGDNIALQLFKNAGASVEGERLRFDPGHVRSLCETAPKVFTMHARKHCTRTGRGLTQYGRYRIRGELHG